MEVPHLEMPGSARGQREQFAPTFQILQQAIAQRAFPGCSFGVLAHGEIVALDGVGRFTYDPDAPEVDIHTVYDLASLTKVLATTAMAMLLFDQRLFRLETPVDAVLPEFDAGESTASPRRSVTFRMLLDHSSGLPGYLPLFETARDPDALYEACLKAPLNAAPGSCAEYSDIGFLLLGRALERLAGEAMDTFCRRELFEPLCMDSARFCPPASWKSAIPPTEKEQNLGLGRVRHLVQGEVNDENAYILGGVAGHAGLFAPAFDVLRFAQCILNDGIGASGKQVFAPETVRLFAQRAEEPPGSPRALGWDTPTEPSSSGRYFGPQSIGHLGFTGTSLWMDRQTALAGVLLTNRTWPDRQNQAIREVRPKFYDSITAVLMPALRRVEDLRAKVMG